MTTTTTKKANNKAKTPTPAATPAPLTIVQSKPAIQNSERMTHTMVKSYEEVTSANKQTIDALVQASQILAKGSEEIGRAVFAVGQASLEKTIANSKAMLGVRNAKEFVDLNSDFLRTQFDSMLSEATKLSELTFRVWSQAAEPVQAQVNANWGKFTTAASQAAANATKVAA